MNNQQPPKQQKTPQAKPHNGEGKNHDPEELKKLMAVKKQQKATQQIQTKNVKES